MEIAVTEDKVIHDVEYIGEAAVFYVSFGANGLALYKIVKAAK